MVMILNDPEEPQINQSTNQQHQPTNQPTNQPTTPTNQLANQATKVQISADNHLEFFPCIWWHVGVDGQFDPIIPQAQAFVQHEACGKTWIFPPSSAAVEVVVVIVSKHECTWRCGARSGQIFFIIWGESVLQLQIFFSFIPSTRSSSIRAKRRETLASSK